MNLESVQHLIKVAIVEGMEISGAFLSDHICKSCLHGKQTRAIISTISRVKNLQVFYHFYSNLCGSMQTTSQLGHHYFMTYIDSASHLLKVCLLKAKNNTLSEIKKIIE